MRWAETAMPYLCAYAIEHGIHADYARELIEAFELAPPTPDAEFWSWAVRLRTLGTFDLSVRDEPAHFTRKAPRRLLQLLEALVALGGADVPVQRLVDAVWPEEDGDGGAHSLQVALTRLRKLLGHADVVQVQDGRVSLNPARCWVDAIVFDRMTAIGTGGDIEHAERACTLYGGAFLAHETEAAWAVPTRERLRTRYVEQVARIGRHHENALQWDRAASWYQRGIDADPLMEAFHQGVIRCYGASGRKAEALGAYRRLRQTLSVVLGIAPSVASQALYDALYAGEG
jgi:DNA-binding SARP family transcriptional activator